jgi:hypothetical protein
VNPIAPQDYADFLAGLKQQIRQRQYQALRAVNHELVALYWVLGESISRKQDEQGWGKSVVENLARDLRLEFPGRNGFSAQNLWLMRQFYLEYHDKPNLQPLVGEISWASNSPKNTPNAGWSRRWCGICATSCPRWATPLRLSATSTGWKAKTRPSESSSVAARIGRTA